MRPLPIGRAAALVLLFGLPGLAEAHTTTAVTFLRPDRETVAAARTVDPKLSAYDLTAKVAHFAGRAVMDAPHLTLVHRSRAELAWELSAGLADAEVWRSLDLLSIPQDAESTESDDLGLPIEGPGVPARPPAPEPEAVSTTLEQVLVLRPRPAPDSHYGFLVDVYRLHCRGLSDFLGSVDPYVDGTVAGLDALTTTLQETLPTSVPAELAVIPVDAGSALLVANAEVEVVGEGRALGSPSFELVEGTYFVNVTARGYTTARARVSLSEGQARVLEVPLAKQAQVCLDASPNAELHIGEARTHGGECLQVDAGASIPARATQRDRWANLRLDIAPGETLWIKPDWHAQEPVAAAPDPFGR
ncbi:MAG: hypothetical protein ABIO70_23290 [Pseudomonadota bacterium]